MHDEIESLKEKYDTLKSEYNDFVYKASHDLNAPMRHIREFSKILIQESGDNLNDTQKQSADFITKNVEKMEKMLASLLQLSRLSTRLQPFTTFEFTMIETYVNVSLRNLIKEKNAQIKWPEEKIELHGDIEQIRNLFLILIENSLKFSKDSQPPKIAISYSQDKNQQIFSVADNGIGIDKKLHNKIFEIFTKLNGQDDSVGMGLTMARKIVENHHGRIWLESEEDKGAVFYFSLEMEE